MQDRYLFRGKRIDNGGWVVGQYVNTCYPGNDKETGHFIVVYPNEYHEIYASTICQCTGLKDKNGKLIWENDIVKYRIYQLTEHLYEIIYDCKEGSWTFGVKDVPLYSIGGANSEKCKVVGNRFDNPELLEVQE